MLSDILLYIYSWYTVDIKQMNEKKKEKNALGTCVCISVQDSQGSVCQGGLSVHLSANEPVLA